MTSTSPGDMPQSQATSTPSPSTTRQPRSTSTDRAPAAVVILPWPQHQLGANNSKGRHWAATYEVREWAKGQGEVAARDQLGKLSRSDALDMLLLYEPPDYRRYDWDGLVTRLKAYQDGMAKGLGIDDYQIWMAHPVRLEPSGDGGRVIALIWRANDSPFVDIVRKYADSFGGCLAFGASKPKRRR